MSKKRRCKSFSLEELQSEVEQECHLQQQFEQFVGIKIEKGCDVGRRICETWLVAKYGIAATVQCLKFMKNIMLLPDARRKHLLEKFCPTVDVDNHGHVFEACLLGPGLDLDVSPDLECEMNILAPPTTKCLLCSSSATLSVKNQCSVVIYSFSGASKATKITTRCQSCRAAYNYSAYGNSSAGWKLYSETRDYVEASDVCYVDRQMFELQCSLANHCWVSFSGWTVAYNEAFKLLNTPHELSEKQTASLFWNGELEAELRSANELNFYGLFHKNEDREVVMEEVERRRSQTVYKHSSQDCSEDCKKRGCGKLWVADGLWKIMFSHCAMSTKNVVSGFPLLNYPDVCTAQPQNGKAFCMAHCRYITSSHPEVPTDLRGFLRYCGVLKNAQATDDNETCILPTNNSEVEKLKCVVQSLSDERSSTIGKSVIQSQGNASVITSSSTQLNSFLDDCIEPNPTACNKDTGEKQRLQKWSRGHFFVVRGSGIIDKWNPLFRSESPSQAFLCLIEWMLITLKDIPESQWNDIFLSYDNMCHVDGMQVAHKSLPFPAPYDKMWLRVNKIIDCLHIANHKSADCKERYNPARLKEILADGNTMAGEQTFTWLSRFKKILCSMPKVHHMFFLHRMVVRRNAYTIKCYKNGKKPVLPKARKGT